MEIEYKEIIWAMAILIMVPQTYIYIRSILIWETKPHIYTKFIWTIVVFIWFLIQVSHGWGAGTWLLWASFITQFITFLLSFKYGTKDITHLDSILLFWALFTIPLYFWIESAIYSLLLIILIDTFAYIPTIRKTYHAPFTESIPAFSLWILKYILSIIALAHYSIYTLAYPVSIVLANSVLVAMMLYRRQWKST